MTLGEELKQIADQKHRTVLDQVNKEIEDWLLTIENYLRDEAMGENYLYVLNCVYFPGSHIKFKDLFVEKVKAWGVLNAVGVNFLNDGTDIKFDWS